MPRTVRPPALAAVAVLLAALLTPFSSAGALAPATTPVPAATATGDATAAISTLPDEPTPATGYALVSADGAVDGFGSASPLTTSAPSGLNADVVDAVLTPSEGGVWQVGADGGVFTLGDAAFLGSAGAIPLNEPIVGIAATPTGEGYWLVASDGGIFSYGDATFHGSTGDTPLNQPIVDMVPTPTGEGYWLVASDGGIFTFGDATFHGSTGDTPLNQPIVDMSASHTGEGYWMVASDGGIFTFGDATFHGSTGDTPLNQPITTMAATPAGDGYWLVANDGGVFTFGEAPFVGSGVQPGRTAGVVAIGAADNVGADLVLTVLHNNDGESNILPTDGFGGAAAFAATVHQLQAAALDGDLPSRLVGTAQGVVTISSGDNFLAGPEFNASLELPDDERFYDSVLLDLIGYDAATIGNHEFDFGPEVLARFIGDAVDTPFISANADFSGEPSLAALVQAGRIAPSVVIEEQGRLVGVVGAITPGLPSISSPGNVAILEDVAGIVQAEIDELLSAGVTRIIVSSHLQGIDEEIALVAELQGVDIVIAGGGDELLADEGDLLLPGTDVEDAFGSYPYIGTDADGRDVPVVTTPGDYNYVGRLAVAFDAAGNVLEVLSDSSLVRVSLTAPDAVEPDAEVQEQVVEPIEASVADLAANVIAQSEVPLDARNTSGVPIRTQETNLGNLVADAMLFAGQQRAATAGLDMPMVSLQNGGGIRNNSIIPAGPLTELDTFSVLPFTNFVTIIEDLTPAELKELLEHSVSALPAANGLFGQWGGITFTYDLTGTAQTIDVDTNTVATPGTRIVSATLLNGGTPIITGGEVDVAAPASIAMALIDFTARGGDNYPFAGKGPLNNLGVSYQQALAEYLTSTAPAATTGGLTGLGGTVLASQYPAVPVPAGGAATRIRPVT